MKWEVEIEEDAEKFLAGLPEKQRTKAYRILSWLREGVSLTGFYTRNISGKLWELKISQIRLFYFLNRNIFVVVSGYLKKSQKAPEYEIKKAESLMRKYLERGG